MTLVQRLNRASRTDTGTSASLLKRHYRYSGGADAKPAFFWTTIVPKWPKLLVSPPQKYGS